MRFEFVYVGALLMPFCVYCLVGLAVVFGLWCFIAGGYQTPDCLGLIVCMCNYLIVLVRCDLLSLVLFWLLCGFDLDMVLIVDVTGG